MKTERVFILKYVKHDEIFDILKGVTYV